jgi:hypothetical protein
MRRSAIEKGVSSVLPAVSAAGAGLLLLGAGSSFTVPQRPPCFFGCFCLVRYALGTPGAVALAGPRDPARPGPLLRDAGKMAARSVPRRSAGRAWRRPPSWSRVTTVGIGIMIDSFRRTLSEWLDYTSLGTSTLLHRGPEGARPQAAPPRPGGGEHRRPRREGLRPFQPPDAGVAGRVHRAVRDARPPGEHPRVPFPGRGSRRGVGGPFARRRHGFRPVRIPTGPGRETRSCCVRQRGRAISPVAASTTIQLGPGDRGDPGGGPTTFMGGPGVDSVGCALPGASVGEAVERSAGARGRRRRPLEPRPQGPSLDVFDRTFGVTNVLRALTV